jgi:hypothetical protein
MTDTAIAPKTKPAPLWMIGGGQKEVTGDDLKKRTFTVKVNVECKTDEREVTAVVPIYEHVLLEARYKREGGEARLTSDWLPSAARYPRVVPLSIDNLRDEVKRLKATYRVHLQNGGVRNFFEDIYGRDGDPVKGFFDIVNKQVRAWRELEARVKQGYRMVAEDLVKISHLVHPDESDATIPEIEDLSDGLIDAEAPAMIAAPDDEDTIIDPLSDLQAFMYKKGWDSEIIMDLCKAVGDGDRINQARVNQLPSLHNKKAERQKLMTDFRAWTTKAEKKATKQEQEAQSEAEATIEPATA